MICTNTCNGFIIFSATVIKTPGSGLSDLSIRGWASGSFLSVASLGAERQTGAGLRPWCQPPPGRWPGLGGDRLPLHPPGPPPTARVHVGRDYVKRGLAQNAENRQKYKQGYTVQSTGMPSDRNLARELGPSSGGSVTAPSHQPARPSGPAEYASPLQGTSWKAGGGVTCDFMRNTSPF